MIKKEEVVVRQPPNYYQLFLNSIMSVIPAEENGHGTCQHHKHDADRQLL